jgi:ubiquinol-cytochrome c reductase cytochrome b subunit
MSNIEERAKARKRQKIESGTLDWVDDRFGSSKWLRGAMDKIFPDHWSFMVGEIAMYCFLILVVTGIYLALYYHASDATVIYNGPYKPLDGQVVSEAYASVINLSFSVRFGLVMRQAHHWAAVIFLAAIAFHICRIFFTGAFRRPREINWIIGLLLLISSMLEGFSGYSLPDDLLSGTGLRVVFSIVESIPFIGTWLAYALWGGTFPGTQLIPRLFVVHEFLFPLAIFGLLGAHLGILWHQKHTDFPGPGKTEHNIVGSRLWPQYAIKSQALLFFVAAAIFGLGGLVQINPIWTYGTYNASEVSAGSQPDWYVGWLDGALRLMPHWEFRSWGFEIPNPFFPGIVIPGIVFTVMFAWPWIDKWIYKDYAEHNLLDRPRDKPFRTAVGCAALTFFIDLSLASATDLLGNNLRMSFEELIEILQYGSFIGPIIIGMVAYKVCVQLQRTDLQIIKKPVGGIIIRSADGAYHTLGAHHLEHDEHAGNGHNGHSNGHNGHSNGHSHTNGHSTGVASDGDGGGEVKGAGADAPPTELPVGTEPATPTED